MRRSVSRSCRARQTLTGAVSSRCRCCGGRSRRSKGARAPSVAGQGAIVGVEERARRARTALALSDCYGTTWPAERSASTRSHAIGVATRPCGPSASSSPPVPTSSRPSSTRRRGERQRRGRAGRGRRRRRRVRCGSSSLERQLDVPSRLPPPTVVAISPTEPARCMLRVILGGSRCRQAGALSVWRRV